MINNEKFYNYLIANDITFFCGVPDSTLKDFCAYISDHTPSFQNIITPNEGNAIALAAGYNLATGKPAMVYMQNSGLGNSVNPITSLADPEVYAIPMILLIGWRGKPGTKDEPQHIKMGKITLDLLDTLTIPYRILHGDNTKAEKSIDQAMAYCNEFNSPFALVVEPGAFESYTLRQKDNTGNYPLSREGVIEIIAHALNKNEIIISTTGKASRELYEYRDRMKQNHEKDFLTVGSMGHTSHIALAIALEKKDRMVYCLDGDGAVIMHMGALAVIGNQPAVNFKHIILNNGSHESVGGQPTVAFSMDFKKLALACGYKSVFSAANKLELEANMGAFIQSDGPALLEVRINKSSRKDLGRPKSTPFENKNEFTKYIRK
jgi:phosphonopyruvate decarboxylase